MIKIYQVLFFTHTGAIKFHRQMKKLNIDCELMPVPRSLSSNCGVSACVHYHAQLATLVDEQVEKIYRKENDHYRLLYESK
ncbi:MAG: DUF3343 domain-containing protein [Bacillota bacterium]